MQQWVATKARVSRTLLRRAAALFAIAAATAAVASSPRVTRTSTTHTRRPALAAPDFSHATRYSKAHTREESSRTSRSSKASSRNRREGARASVPSRRSARRAPAHEELLSRHGAVREHAFAVGKRHAAAESDSPEPRYTRVSRPSSAAPGAAEEAALLREQHAAVARMKTAAPSARIEHPMTVDDFLRAAGSSRPAAKPSPHAAVAPYATGVARPDSAEPQTTAAEQSVSAQVRRAIAPEPITDEQAAPQSSTHIDTALVDENPSDTNLSDVSNAVIAVNAAPASIAPANTAAPHLTPKGALVEEAIAPRVPGLYDREGHLIVPPPLKGSHEVLVHQNEMADAAGLSRIRNNADLDRMLLHHQLESIAGSAALHVNPQLPADRRAARPWAVQFAGDMARAFYAEFHEPLELTSAARTIQYQRRLQRVNGNAAAITGDGASPHLTGQALDFGKSGMTMAEIAWMRAYLLPLMQAGKLDVEEEFQQACFHISVYRSYLTEKKAPRNEVAMR